MVYSIYVIILGSRVEYSFEKYRLLNEVVFCILGSVFLVALTCFVCTLQLGLDQMPDASSSSIASFIAWFVFSISAGGWIGEFLNVVLKDKCFGLVTDSIKTIFIVCVLLYLQVLFLFSTSFSVKAG